MSLPAGCRLGFYEIVAQLGAGGMGEVYKARDTRLNRFVAIKVLPPEHLADEGRRQRFIQEARTASALNHPNIISIYEIDSFDGRDYMVMEFIAGKELNGLIPRTGLRLREFLRIAIQVSDGLAAAHAAGIVHRDLKPSNIMVSDTGQVKILDFGLAKLAGVQEPGEQDMTLTLRPRTEAGVVMGTMAYMSPEQAEGKPLDPRSDIFSFGAVMYEMASGRRAFPGSSPAATVAAVLNQEPKPLREAAPGLPYELEKLIMRCLRKDIGTRQQNVTDLKLLLEDLKEETGSGKLPGSGATSAKRRLPILIMIAAFIVVIAGAGFWLSRRRDPEQPSVVQLTTFSGREDYPSFSPDGGQVVFAWNGEKQDKWDLYVKIIGAPTALRLTTDGADNLFPAWSPDGKQIAFIKRGHRAGLYLISPLGGPEQKIADFDAAGPPAWSPDGKLLLVAKPYLEQTATTGGGTVFVVPVGGGEPRPVLVPDPGKSYLYPAFNSSGRSLAVASCKGVFILRTCDVDTVSLNSEWLPQGKPRRLSAVAKSISGLAWTEDGRGLVVGTSTSPVSDFFLWLVDSAGGEPKRLEIASQGASSPAIAPKGHRLAFSRGIHDSDIWRLERDGTALTSRPFLVSSTFDSSAQFSPDGSRIAFASDRDGLMAIWLAQANGSGLLRLTRGPENFSGSPRWSPDGRWIAFDARNTEGKWSIQTVETGGGPTRLVVGGLFNANVPSWSRDGKWIYFTSERTGRNEIWRAPAEGGSAEQITRNGGYVALEGADRKTLYYTKTVDPDAQLPLYARPLAGGEEKQVLAGVRHRAFEVFDDGIFYITDGGPAGDEIRFYDFAKGRSRVVASIQGQLGLSLSVSLDRNTFLFTKVISVGSDLMLIENFR